MNDKQCKRDGLAVIRTIRLASETVSSICLNQGVNPDSHRQPQFQREFPSFEWNVCLEVCDSLWFNYVSLTGPCFFKGFLSLHSQDMMTQGWFHRNQPTEKKLSHHLLANNWGIHLFGTEVIGIPKNPSCHGWKSMVYDYFVLVMWFSLLKAGGIGEHDGIGALLGSFLNQPGVHAVGFGRAQWQSGFLRQW